MSNFAGQRKLSDRIIQRSAIAACVFVTTLITLIVSASGQVSRQFKQTYQFDVGAITFSNEFSGARMNACRQTADDEFEVIIEPENEPINDSAWYAFRVRSAQPREISVRLLYDGGAHRYEPKTSRDGEQWERLDSSRYDVSPDRESATLRLAVGPTGLLVAGQELISNQEVDVWMERLKERLNVSREVIGLSIEKRAIEQLEIGEANAPYCVVIVGRQHPPEVTGMIGLMQFVERVVQVDELAKQFRESFKLLVVPNMNPDGVEHGHWRHNMAGVDLNRDWGRFTQPETRAVRDKVRELHNDPTTRVVLFLDFHSTYHDVFYTQADNEPMDLEAFTSEWLEMIQRRFPNYEVRRDADHGSDTTSKAWIHKLFGVPAITYEFGDETGREQIRQLARGSAEEMMRWLVRWAARSERVRDEPALVLP